MRASANLSREELEVFKGLGSPLLARSGDLVTGYLSRVISTLKGMLIEVMILITL